MGCHHTFLGFRGRGGHPDQRKADYFSSQPGMAWWKEEESNQMATSGAPLSATTPWAGQPDLPAPHSPTLPFIASPAARCHWTPPPSPGCPVLCWALGCSRLCGKACPGFRPAGRWHAKSSQEGPVHAPRVASPPCRSRATEKRSSGMELLSRQRISAGWQRWPATRRRAVRGRRSCPRLSRWLSGCAPARPPPAAASAAAATHLAAAQPQATAARWTGERRSSGRVLLQLPR